MDTTSHNFTFHSWTFGTIGSSTLYDVDIINETGWFSRSYGAVAVKNNLVVTVGY